MFYFLNFYKLDYDPDLAVSSWGRGKMSIWSVSQKVEEMLHELFGFQLKFTLKLNDGSMELISTFASLKSLIYQKN